jgi:predicted nucleotidyltransferase
MKTRDFPTLAQRKAARVAFLHEAVAALRDRLRGYAHAHAGRFLLYGSAARGDLRFDSDIDVLIDFPEHRLSEAWRFAEDLCRELDLKADLCPLAWCRDDFLAHIGKHAEPLE